MVVVVLLATRLGAAAHAALLLVAVLAVRRGGSLPVVTRRAFRSGVAAATVPSWALRFVAALAAVFLGVVRLGPAVLVSVVGPGGSLVAVSRR